uniref:Uncharacterized protein n=1 Tax=Anopheles coluzzii TaxID=1518534 RepID=A0A8W7PKJ7_ANOCL
MEAHLVREQACCVGDTCCMSICRCCVLVFNLHRKTLRCGVVEHGISTVVAVKMDKMASDVTKATLAMEIRPRLPTITITSSSSSSLSGMSSEAYIYGRKFLSTEISTSGESAAGAES